MSPLFLLMGLLGCVAPSAVALEVLGHVMTAGLVLLAIQPDAGHESTHGEAVIALSCGLGRAAADVHRMGRKGQTKLDVCFELAGVCGAVEEPVMS